MAFVLDVGSQRKLWTAKSEEEEEEEDQNEPYFSDSEWKAIDLPWENELMYLAPIKSIKFDLFSMMWFETTKWRQPKDRFKRFFFGRFCGRPDLHAKCDV